MKFSNGKPDRSNEEPTAYIDSDGDLMFRTIDGKTCGLEAKSGRMFDHNEFDWDPDAPANGLKFYPGDQIVIDIPRTLNPAQGTPQC